MPPNGNLGFIPKKWTVFKTEQVPHRGNREVQSAKSRLLVFEALAKLSHARVSLDLKLTGPLLSRVL